MFNGFFFCLRAHKIMVTPTEWLALMEALDRGFAGNSLVSFYHLSRSLLVKTEALSAVQMRKNRCQSQGPRPPRCRVST